MHLNLTWSFTNAFCAILETSMRMTADSNVICFARPKQKDEARSRYEDIGIENATELQRTIAEQLLKAKFGSFDLVARVVFKDDTIEISNSNLRWSPQVIAVVEKCFQEIPDLICTFQPGLLPIANTIVSLE